MTAAIAYYSRLLAYRQSALPPMLLYVAFVAMIYASDPGAPIPAATVTGVALMLVCAWTTRLVAGAESEPFADVISVALGGSVRRLLARACATACIGLVLTAIAVAWGRAAVRPPHRYDAQVFAVIVGLHLAQVVAGIGLGCLIAPPLKVTAGLAVVVTTAVTVASLLVPWLPPFAPMLQTLGRSPTPGPALLFLVVVQAAAAGALAAAAAAALIRRQAP